MLEISSHPATPFAIGIVLAWLAGVRVYLTIFGIGVAAAMGWMELPPSLALASSPPVLVLCALLALVEFGTDKMPGVDSLWDLAHTLVRIPAGAFLGGLALPTDSGEPGLAGMAIGAGVAALSHGLKSGTRALINTSPEPASNWSASLAEDGVVLVALGLLVTHPYWALALVVAASVVAVVVLVLLWRLLRRLTRAVRSAVA
jgi:hypothetical protein